MNKSLEDIIMSGLLGAVAMLILPYIMLIILGFTKLGIRGRSPAAFIHSIIGDVRPESFFATLQRTAVQGLPARINYRLLRYGFIGGVAICLLYL